MILVDFMEIFFNQKVIDSLLKQASETPRKRVNMDLRNGESDLSQRMLNAIMPETIVPIHRHEDTSETVVCLCGKLEEIFYELVDESKNEYREIARYLLSPSDGCYGMQIPKNVWHTIQVLEPSVIFEAKDGAYKP